MFDTYNNVLQATDHELLTVIAMVTSGLFIMRVCQWVYVACKWLHDWLSSMFPVGIDKK